MVKTRIVIDAMGGDNAPEAIVKGAVSALKEADVLLTFVGRQQEIEGVLSGLDYDKSSVRIENADDVITNEESPVTAIRRKKDSSLVKALTMLKEGKGDAFVSAGSTGAVLAGATFIVGRIKGVERPALGVYLPTEKGMSLLIDCGANVDSKPSYLKQFAYMGSAYYENTFGTNNASVALINNGSESKKGNRLTKEAYTLLEEDDTINFVGNVEGRHISEGFAQVYVCDGFVGNVTLKLYEGVARSLMRMIKKEIMSSAVSKVGGLLIKGSMKNMKDSMDYTKYGGAPLLGLNNLVVKCHGSSNDESIKNAIFQCKKFVDNKVNDKIKQKIDKEFLWKKGNY